SITTWRSRPPATWNTAGRTGSVEIAPPVGDSLERSHSPFRVQLRPALLDSRIGSQAEHAHHVSRLDSAGEDFLLVKLVHAIDKVRVGLRVDTEIRPECAIDERVDHVGETDEKLVVETLVEHRQDVLSPNTLEPRGRAVSIYELPFELSAFLRIA